ncbi:hypothetical protein SAMN05421788_108230 [Filimonas lacunae]|uniref:Uncharacterized protein n=1 Tax=Filimonas lacunae TaxID=477680 RepID=A0A173MDG0_9BACT|nr:hypothetical protein [Filimonas lacunae]BAV05624.1 hypothetical protein FLA_1635 [Filimonas lacunae]SIT29150.1 hypothetical protein SAMN05421788_108230 [Filimonas lacunae]
MSIVMDMELASMPIRLLFQLSRTRSNKTEQEIADLLNIDLEEYRAMEHSLNEGFTGEQQNVLYQYYKSCPNAFENMLFIWKTLYVELRQLGMGDMVHELLWDTAFTLHEKIADNMLIPQ